MFKIELYDMSHKLYISEKSDIYEDCQFTKGHLISDFTKYGFNDVLNNISGIDLFDIFKDIITSLEPNIYYPSKQELNKCLVKAENVYFQMSYEFQFYVDSIILDVSEKDGDIVNHESMIRNFIKMKYENNEDDKTSELKGYFDLGRVKRIFGIFPGKKEIYNEKLDCLYIAYKCNLDDYIQALYVVIEFINKALELEDPAIVLDYLKNSKIKL